MRTTSAFSQVAGAPRSDDLSAIRAFREVLESADFTADGVRRHLGDSAVEALSRDQAAPALLALDRHRSTGTWDGVCALIELFILARSVSVQEVKRVLPQIELDQWMDLGLVEAVLGLSSPGEDTVQDGGLTQNVSQGWVRSVVDLDLHAADSGLELWVAADLTAFQRPGAALRHDYVLGIGGASLTLAQITERPQVQRALDIGTGCGVQLFHLLQHCRHVVATDLSERALAFTRFNLVLNAPALGLDPEHLEDRVELRQGSLLEPVAGDQFNLVVTNPPFVITPRSPGETEAERYIYRDGGRPGDRLVADLVGQLDTVMTTGAVAHLLANWEVPATRQEFDGTGSQNGASFQNGAGGQDGQGWQDRVAAWIPEALDAWVIQRETQSPETYAETWLRDASEHLDRDSYESAYRAYLEDFAARNVAAVGFGYVRLQKPGGSRQRRRRFEELTHPFQQPIAPVTAEVVQRQDVLNVLGQRWTDLHLVVPEHVTEERHLRPGAADPSVILLRQGAGLQRTNVLTSNTAGLVGACDGELSVRQIVTALGALLGWEQPAEESVEGKAVLEEARHLLMDGFLAPDD